MVTVRQGESIRQCIAIAWRAQPGVMTQEGERHTERLTAGGGLAPAFAAVRPRLVLVAALLALAGAGWWWTVRQMRGMDEGPWTGLGTLGWFLGSGS
jgi:hypothetical protein